MLFKFKELKARENWIEYMNLDEIQEQRFFWNFYYNFWYKWHYWGNVQNLNMICILDNNTVSMLVS